MFDKTVNYVIALKVKSKKNQIFYIQSNFINYQITFCESYLIFNRGGQMFWGIS